MPVRALVEAGGFFGMESASVRVALARLLSRERVERDERGRYRLGAGADAVSGTIRGWRRLDAQTVEWCGGWVGVYRSRGDARPLRLAGDRALSLLGFRALEPNLFLRPDNLVGGIDGLRSRLSGMGLEASALVFGLGELDSDCEGRARDLWDLAGLNRAYREGVRVLSRSRGELEGASNEKAMVETFRLGGQAIRQLVLDPLLPSAIARNEERDALAVRMLDYDVFGRGCWAEFLQKHGVLHLRTPADLRVAVGTEGLAFIPSPEQIGDPGPQPDSSSIE